MSAIYNPESDAIARIESLELEIRDIRRRIEHAPSAIDKRILNKQIEELKDEITFLRSKLD